MTPSDPRNSSKNSGLQEDSRTAAPSREASGSAVCDGIRIAELLALCDAASPGPWALGVTDTASPAEVGEHLRENALKGEGPVAWLLLHPDDYDGSAHIQHARATATTGNGPTSEANARFIAAARTAVPELLREVTALRSALAAPETPDPDARVKKGFRIGIEAAAKVADAEAQAYRDSSVACDTAGNHVGATGDLHGAIACDLVANRIRALAAPAPRDEVRALELLVAAKRRKDEGLKDATYERLRDEGWRLAFALAPSSAGVTIAATPAPRDACDDHREGGPDPRPHCRCHEIDRLFASPTEKRRPLLAAPRDEGPRDDEWLIECTQSGTSDWSALFWAPNRCGYTTDLDAAGRYTEAEAKAQERSRPGVDIARRLSDVLALARPRVDRCTLHRELARAPEPESAPRDPERSNS